MADYRKIAEAALKKSLIGKPKLNESVVYPDGLNERMHPDLETDLAEGKHSLGKHPIFPDGDETSFEQKIMGKRFSEVTKRYKKAFDVDSIDNGVLLSQMMPIVHESMVLESKHKKELEELAIRMIREEYDMSEDVVEIHAELTPVINMVGTKKNPKPMAVEMEFKNHEDITTAKDEVYKRRFLNAMTQGAAKKCNHMFHMVEEELTEMEPRLSNHYAKMMSAADYMYYVIPKMENGTNGGIVRVQFPNANNPKAVIHVQAMVFPVLIHELVKGVMELLSAHGLPKDKKIGEYVINKADFLAAEPWDMRLGPALWEQFTNAIEPDDFELKHHIYSELAALPVKEFNVKMREIMSGTKDGKELIKNMVNEIRNGIKEDDFNEAMGEMAPTIKSEPTEIEDDTFDFDDFLGSDDEDTFDYDDLF